MIYHMLPTAIWAQQAPDEAYEGDTLASEGFIHCTDQPGRLVWVANRFYQQLAGDFLILCIEPTRVQAEIKWEQADQATFPHIYGPLNQDAVVNVIQFPRDAMGAFWLPPELA
ncbi:DUF952 domain-containing protein [soil metagenome]